MTEAVITANNITKVYKKTAAVSNLNLQVTQGDIYALVGQNGAGKTTLLKMICGLTPPTSGSLELFSQTTPHSLAAARAHMGTMIETPGFYPYLSAKDNLAYYQMQRGSKNKAAIGEVLEFVGLADAGSKKFRDFSLGMKQRLGLASAIVDSPDVLVLDEPINGLDPMGIKEFREIIRKLNRERKTTILISSHILGELSQIATTYGFISHGEMVEHISAQNLQEKCRSYLRIDTDNAQTAANLLQSRCGCRNLEIVNAHTLHVGERMDDAGMFVKELVENGITVSQVYRAGINLEEYFIQLIGGTTNA
ncbi:MULTISPECIES: ABC transporter ATP-binding protein [Caproicibacterium]|uniref:ABC transporter ATP-binding protein n=1 Tax=Caproicibacterium argilliputei TaxID=3030016 RepID=A0AA97DAP0_9FIRM|nr:ABC transporter ATP-binding protein [Caproicibacterium argilliputei]WOC32727.1 ABC transporter ATP-binding protein [Caproicibacterium argilliputei]